MINKLGSTKEEDIDNRKIIKYIIIFILFIIIVVLLFGSVYTIPAGYKGIVLTFDKPNDIATGEGLNFKIPFVQSVVKMDTRTQKYEADLSAASSDLQDVNTKIAINYHLSPESVIEVYRSIGTNYAEKIIYPLEQESNKAATAQFVAADLVNKREAVRAKMEEILRNKLSPRGIVIESISIVDFKFSAVYSAAIENKVTAEQNALAAKNKLEQIKYEADQRIAQAEGEAKAIKIQAEAIVTQGGKEYVQLQAINKWDGKMPIVFGTGSLPFIAINATN